MLKTASLMASYLGVEPGKLVLQDKTIKRSLKGKEIIGLATIILQYVEESKNFKWTNRTHQFAVYQWFEFASCYGYFISHPSCRRKVLTKLNNYLADHSYLVGYSKTLADIIIYYFIFDSVIEMNAVDKETLAHVCRWFDHIQSDKEIRQSNLVLNFSICNLGCATMSDC